MHRESYHPYSRHTDLMHVYSYLLPRHNPVFGKFEVKDAMETDGLWDVYNNFAMGNCGEYSATKHGITREAQDSHAIESYRRAERAWKEGAFDAEIAPVTVKGKKGDVVVKEDEEYKRVIYEKIPTLKPAFKPNGGTITAANSSNLNDGASALILMSAAKAAELGVKPLAKIICEPHDLFSDVSSCRYHSFQPMRTSASNQLTFLARLPLPYPWRLRMPVSASLTSPCTKSTRLSLRSCAS